MPWEDRTSNHLRMPLNNNKRKNNNDHQAGSIKDRILLAQETRIETSNITLNNSGHKLREDGDLRTPVSSVISKDTVIENAKNTLACSHHKMDIVSNVAEHITVNADPAEQELKPLGPELKHKLQH